MIERDPSLSRTGLMERPGRSETLMDALDRTARGGAGMAFHGPRGVLREAFSYADLADDARRTGAMLLGRGLTYGDRVGLVADTEGDFVRGFVGCLAAGLVPCPMPLPAAFGMAESYGETIRRIAAVAGVAAVVTAEEYRDKVVPPLRATGLGLRFVGPLGDLDPRATAPLPATIDPDALAYLQFSSGTTSAPKGIAISHRALMANVYGIGADKLGISASDRGVSWLPFYHDMGLVGCMLLPIAMGLSIDYLATRDFIRQPGLWLQLISANRATMSYAPSFGYELVARRPRGTDGLDLGSWRIAGIGGDMIRARSLETFASAFADRGFRRGSFVPSYGMAEVGLGIAFPDLGRSGRFCRLDVDRLERGEAVDAIGGRSRSFAICGTALPGHELEIRDAAGSPVPEGRIGTIFCHGPSMMQGYFQDPQATAQVLDPGGWLDTGDLGFMLDRELVVTGRAKDLMIVNGRNIWPQDIEWTVEHHLQGAREGGVVVFGAGSTDEDEERVTVIIECRGSEEDRAGLRAGADALVRETHGVTPRVVLSRPGLLPRTSSGKLSRVRAREMYRSGQFYP